MNRVLSDEVVDQIVFGMENQEEEFYFDREKQVLVNVEDISEEELEENPARYASIPQWRPVDGFHMMEQFTGSLKNPVYREELREVLKGGRGVFRRFKDLLKRYEPLERLWFTFKEREMRKIVHRWYASIIEAEKMARLGKEPEETEQLLLSDLEVKEREETTAEREDKIEKAMAEAMDGLSSELCELLLEERLATNDPATGVTVEVCLPSEEVVATVGGEFFAAEEGDVFRMAYLYVEPSYRGMGISRLLLDRLNDIAKKREAKELVVDIPSSSSFMERELRERGFNEYARGYSLRWSRFD